MKKQILKKLLDDRLVAIIRVEDPGEIGRIVECLVEGGVESIEITSNTPGYLGAISTLREEYPQLLIGAGTITSPVLAEESVKAGAQFLVTPNTHAAVVSTAHAHGVPVIMGAMTPTEVVEAQEAKADIIKLFPAGALGPDYLKSLAGGPFLGTAFFAVGGVDEHNVEKWMKSGAAGVGVGGSLARPVSSPSEAEKLIERVQTLVQRLNQ